MSNGEVMGGGRREYEFNKPENKAKYDERLSAIDGKVQKSLFGSFPDMLKMLGDEQYKEVTDIINEDIFNGKYEDATYENGLVFHIGSVNEEGKRVSDWDELDIPEYRKPENKAKYDEQLKKIDPQVFNKIQKVVHILGDTLNVESVEYMDACNKINQDIYDGRYEKARYEITSDKGDEFERGVIIFDKES